MQRNQLSSYLVALRRLADFGLSRLVSEHKTHVSAATMGTVSYMPPEMLSEQRLTKAVSCYQGLDMHNVLSLPPSRP